MNKDSPKAVALAKVDRPIHGFHAALGKPFFTIVKQSESNFFVFNTLKKAHPARGLIISFVDGILVYKRRHSPNRLTGIIHGNPSNTFSVFEILIFYRD